MRIHRYVLRTILLSFDRDSSIRVKVDDACAYTPHMTPSRSKDIDIESFTEVQWGEAYRVFGLIKQADLFKHIALDEFELTIPSSLEAIVNEISDEIFKIDFDGKNRDDHLNTKTKHIAMQSRLIARVKGYVRSAY